MIRALLGVTAGIALAVALIQTLQGLGLSLYPPPAGLDPADRQAFAAAVRQVPAAALLLVLAAYVVGAFGGAWTAAHLTGRPFYAFLVGGVLTLASAAKVAAVPSPIWFRVAAILVFLPSAWLASRLAQRR